MYNNSSSYCGMTSFHTARTWLIQNDTTAFNLTPQLFPFINIFSNDKQKDNLLNQTILIFFKIKFQILILLMKKKLILREVYILINQLDSNYVSENLNSFQRPIISTKNSIT